MERLSYCYGKLPSSFGKAIHHNHGHIHKSSCFPLHLVCSHSCHFSHLSEHKLHHRFGILQAPDIYWPLYQQLYVSVFVVNIFTDLLWVSRVKVSWKSFEIRMVTRCTSSSTSPTFLPCPLVLTNQVFAK